MTENKIKIDADSESFERYKSYKRFMYNEKNPWVMFTGTVDVGPIVRLCKKRSLRYNAVLMFCMQNAAEKIKEFHYSIQEDGLYFYNHIKTNLVIKNINGGLSWPDIKFCEKLEDYLIEYNKRFEQTYKTCQNYHDDCGAMFATSAIINFPFDSISIPLSDCFWDTFAMWGAYKKRFRKIEQTISLRIHHAVMDGEHVGMFFANLSQEIKNLKKFKLK